MRAYLAITCGLPVAVAAGVGLLNYCVDPYLLHQWDSPAVERLGPYREKLNVWGKTYALARFQPQVLYVGNSRTEVGLPADVPQYAGRRVFNGAVSGASLGDTMRMARYASQVSKLDTIVWGLDMTSFTLGIGNTDIDDALVNGGPAYVWRRRVMDLKRAISPDMTRDTFRLLSGGYGGDCRSSLFFHGQRDAACIRAAISHNGGTEASVVPRTGDFLSATGPQPGSLLQFRQALEALCPYRLRLYVNPTHAITIDALYQAGRGAQMEQWLSSLAEMASEMRSKRCDVKVYDFSGFNAITTEALPQASGKTDLHNFWEPSHYRDNVGRMILARVEGGAEGTDGFGAELRPEQMVAHIARLRDGLARYRLDHPSESALASKASAIASR